MRKETVQAKAHNKKLWKRIRKIAQANERKRTLATEQSKLGGTVKAIL